ncbi:glycosyltransferase [Streptomyces sp. NPDC048362]|uniref:glycosyltransferase n=1 Tax=Streptomyces sp. NPDC048362 TaxID=3365539 RepID=UPI0037131184
MVIILYAASIDPTYKSLSGRRFLVVSTNYAPEHAGVGPYSTMTAEHLAACGANVDVLAGMPHYPAWRVDHAYRATWRTTEVRQGVRVHRRRHFVPSKQTALRRALYEVSFLAHGALSVPVDKPELVLSQVPSLAGGVIGARISRRWAVPHVVVVQDLLGAAAVQSGIRGGSRVASIAGRIEARIMRSATRIGVVHESFADRIVAMGIPPGKIRVVPNWAHVRPPSGSRKAMRTRLGWRDNEVVVLHSGNMGLKQGLEVLVDTARFAIRERSGIRVVLMGDGSQRATLQKLASTLPNVDVRPPATDEEFPDVLAAADVLAVTQRASVLDMSLPSKLTSYFAAGRPVVASVAVHGGTAAEVRRSGAGIVVPPEDAEVLHGAIMYLVGDPKRSERLGARGPAYVIERLSMDAGLRRITALVSEALTAHNGR